MREGERGRERKGKRERQREKREGRLKMKRERAHPALALQFFSAFTLNYKFEGSHAVNAIRYFQRDRPSRPVENDIDTACRSLVSSFRKRRRDSRARIRTHAYAGGAQSDRFHPAALLILLPAFTDRFRKLIFIGARGGATRVLRNPLCT